MPKYNEINSKNNQLIKDIIRLITNSNYRHETGLAIVSGKTLISEATKHCVIKDVLVSRDSIKKYQGILDLCDNIYILDNEVIKKISLVDSGSDLIAIIKIKKLTFDNKIYQQDCIILENLSDPGNLGTILRAAAATNIKNIILSNGSVDPYNPKVLRSSAGIQFGLNIFTNIDINEFVTKYKGSILATTPHTSTTIYENDLTIPIAWVFGNEGSGISIELLNKIINKVKIPMPGNAESLNVAMAATICLFEMVRQRSIK
jgi:RNA methyltransferase, TrmH family